MRVITTRDLNKFPNIYYVLLLITVMSLETLSWVSGFKLDQIPASLQSERSEIGIYFLALLGKNCLYERQNVNIANSIAHEAEYDAIFVNNLQKSMSEFLECLPVASDEKETDEEKTVEESTNPDKSSDHKTLPKNMSELTVLEVQAKDSSVSKAVFLSVVKAVIPHVDDKKVIEMKTTRSDVLVLALPDRLAIAVLSLFNSKYFLQNSLSPIKHVSRFDEQTVSENVLYARKEIPSPYVLPKAKDNRSDSKIGIAVTFLITALIGCTIGWYSAKYMHRKMVQQQQKNAQPDQSQSQQNPTWIERCYQFL